MKTTRRIGRKTGSKGEIDERGTRKGKEKEEGKEEKSKGGENLLEKRGKRTTRRIWKKKTGSKGEIDQPGTRERERKEEGEQGREEKDQEK